MFWVYIIYSSSLGKYYVGSTENIHKRIDQHNTGRGNFTSKGIPWILIISFRCSDRTEAVQLELK
ncbi:MAG TPA: GIY-YIG nuclease family protein, partial [Agriterribacter sp.]|nr:GIY-YIG nuclease family protein [Agriterribacter sp.]